MSLTPVISLTTTALRLHFRQKLALLYSYLFPTLFLLAYWVLYRYDQVPLVRHIGALLTVTVLGGACFGLPTTLVSERERGVWRRYRLAPVPTRTLLAGTLLARLVLLLLAGLLQLGLAMLLGMPAPRHPVDLLLAFLCVAAAWLGVGLLLAMLAPTVPAVQALGQCVFLPMLILGGIAVPLASLPPWAQRLAAFFPGRYAVEALQAAVTGPGLGAARFSVLALLAIGAAGALAGTRLFRWDPQHRVATPAGYAWVAVALGAWVAVGVIGEARTRRSLPPSIAESAPPPAGDTTSPPPGPRPEPAPARTPRLSPREETASRVPPRSKLPASPPVAPVPAAAPSPAPAGWQAVTDADIARDIVAAALPPDSGIVTPIAAPGEEPDPNQTDLLEHIRRTLIAWTPAQVDDPVLRARTLLYVAGVADIQQLTLERHIPLLVFDQLQADVPREDLRKVLYWIAMYPDEDPAAGPVDLRALRLDQDVPDAAEVRNRIAIYAAKLLVRMRR